MTFTVLWRDTAEANLLASLLRAADKPGLWAVARAIDARLRADPHAEGESRGPARRISRPRGRGCLLKSGRVADAAAGPVS